MSAAREALLLAFVAAAAVLDAARTALARIRGLLARVPRWLWLFGAANLGALAWTAYAGAQPWVGEAGAVPASLVRRWLPFALALAAVGTAALAPLVAPAARTAFLWRHFALYAAVPAVLLLLRLSPGDPAHARIGTLYLLVALGFAAHALGALWRALPALPDRRVAVSLAGIALVVYLSLLPYHRAVQPTASDEPHYLLIMQSLLYDGDLDLRNDYEGDRYRVFYPDRLPDMHGIEIGDAVYPIRDLGLPLLGTLPFALAGRDGVLALMCLVGAALVLQLHLLLRDLRFTPRVAFLAAAAAGLTHPLLTYTTQIYPELIAALVLVSAARVLRHGDALRARDLALASALVAALPWLSTRASLIAVGVGLAVAYWALRPLWARTVLLRARPADGRERRPGRPPLRRRLGWTARNVLAAALPFAVIVGALAYVNWLMFGLFMPSTCCWSRMR